MGDALTALRTLEEPRCTPSCSLDFRIFMPNPGSGACEVLFNISHREINFERLTCRRFAQLLTQMRQLVGVIFRYAARY
jgi:hypothetical protein